MRHGEHPPTEYVDQKAPLPGDVVGQQPRSVGPTTGATTPRTPKQRKSLPPLGRRERIRQSDWATGKPPPPTPGRMGTARAVFRLAKPHSREARG